MADDDDTAVIDTRDTAKLLDRIQSVSRQKFELRQQLKEAQAKVADYETKLADLPRLEKELAKITAERDTLSADAASWATEREIIGAGITDPEGIEAAQWAWSRLAEDKRPESMGEWLKGEPDTLPKVLQPFLPKPAEADPAPAGRRPPPDPSAGVRRTSPAPADAPRLHGGAAPSDYASSRAAIWEAMGIPAPKLPGGDR